MYCTVEALPCRCIAQQKYCLVEVLPYRNIILQKYCLVDVLHCRCVVLQMYCIVEVFLCRNIVLQIYCHVEASLSKSVAMQKYCFVDVFPCRSIIVQKVLSCRFLPFQKYCLVEVLFCRCIGVLSCRIFVMLVKEQHTCKNYFTCVSNRYLCYGVQSCTWDRLPRITFAGQDLPALRLSDWKFIVHGNIQCHLSMPCLAQPFLYIWLTWPLRGIR